MDNNFTHTNNNLKELKELFKDNFLSDKSDIYMFLENFDDLEDFFHGLHPEIREFCDHNKMFIVLKNYDKYEHVKTDFKRNIFNYPNIYLRGLKNYFDDDLGRKYNIEPIQSLSHMASCYIYSENFYWVNTSKTIGEDFNQFEGIITNNINLFKNVSDSNNSLLHQSKVLNERKIEGVDYTKRDNENFENTGCLIYFIPVILISLMFLIL